MPIFQVIRFRTRSTSSARRSRVATSWKSAREASFRYPPAT